MMNACARPSGEGCTAYSISISQSLPLPSKRWKAGLSSGVVMISTRRIPASISTPRG